MLGKRESATSVSKAGFGRNRALYLGMIPFHVIPNTPWFNGTMGASPWLNCCRRDNRPLN